MTPYDILQVKPDAADAEIRKAYLELVKTYTPDTHPDRFRLINSAYEKIKTEAARIEWLLFNRDLPGESPFQSFVNHVTHCTEREPMPFDTLKQFLADCAKE